MENKTTGRKRFATKPWILQDHWTTTRRKVLMQPEKNLDKTPHVKENECRVQTQCVKENVVQNDRQACLAQWNDKIISSVENVDFIGNFITILEMIFRFLAPSM